MRRARGFTLIELMVVIALIAITTTIAVPALHSLIQNNRATTQANALLSGLTLARSEAVKHGSPVSICARKAGASSCSGDNDWSGGWLVFTDPGGTGDYESGSDTLIAVANKLQGQSTLVATADGAHVSVVSYAATGFLNAAATASEIQIALQIPGCTGDGNRLISINPQGRATVSHTPC